MAASYQIPLDVAFWDFPVDAAAALFPAMARRLGWELKGPDTVETAQIKAAGAMKAHLQKHYTILPPKKKARAAQPAQPAAEDHADI